MALPEIGSVAPAFSLANQDGNHVSLAEQAGKNVLVWFYPRAFGRNWTIEASGFRDRIPDFEAKNTTVLGITFSPLDDLKSWRQEVGLGADLLCDADRAVAMAYGAAESADQEKAKRVSVLVGPDGRVRRVYNEPDAASHPAEVLADLTWNL